MANPISKLNLVINGVTTQLDVHDANALTTEIDSMGVGWVRFKCGLQICYGSVINNNNIANGASRHSYPVAFSAIPNVVATAESSQSVPYFVTVTAESETNFIVYSWWATTPPALTSGALKSHYVAIGRWK